jgi:hypothetical protein
LRRVPGAGVIDTAIRVQYARGDSRGNKGARCEVRGVLFEARWGVIALAVSGRGARVRASVRE